MNINVKYNIGDKVNWRIPQEGTEDVICPFCNGIKLVQGHDNSTLPCPKCEGKGTIKEVGYREGSSIITGFNVTYDTTDMRNYVDGPRIIYYADRGNVNERFITGIVSEN